MLYVEQPVPSHKPRNPNQVLLKYIQNSFLPQSMPSPPNAQITPYSAKIPKVLTRTDFLSTNTFHTQRPTTESSPPTLIHAVAVPQ